MRALDTKPVTHLSPSPGKTEGTEAPMITNPLNVISEREFQAAVREYAESQGWVIFTTRDSKHSPAGEPDLRLVRERVVWVELKRELGKTTQKQEEAITVLAHAGAEVYVWRPSSWTEIEQVLGS